MPETPLPMPGSLACILPAKALSTRLPAKNRRALHGRPMFRYGLEAALAAGCFDPVVVSTDDPLIAEEAARMAGVQVDIRPERMCGDGYSADQVAVELLVRRELAGRPGVCVVNPCCPLVQPFHLREAAVRFLQGDAAMVASVSRYRYDPLYYLTLRQGVLVRHWKDARVQSNAAEEKFFGNGAFNIVRMADYLARQTVFVEPIAPYVMDDWYAYDVDTPGDLELVERQMTMLAAMGRMWLDIPTGQGN